MVALKQYAKHFKKMLAQQKILADLKKQALRELKKQPNGQAIVGGVELHMTKKKTATIYPEDIAKILENLKTQTKEQIKRAEDAGQVKCKFRETFDAAVPKSAQKRILSEDKDYARHFGVTM